MAAPQTPNLLPGSTPEPQVDNIVRQHPGQLCLLFALAASILTMLLPTMPPWFEDLAGMNPAQGLPVSPLLLAGLSTTLLAGASLLSTHTRRPLRGTGVALAGLVVGLQMILLASGLTGDTSNATRIATPGGADPRFAPSSFAYAPAAMVAVGLLAVIPLLIAAGRGRRHLAYWLAVGGMGIAVVDLVGSLLTLDQLFDAYAHWAMHWITACSLIPIGAGFMLLTGPTAAELSVRPDRRIIYSAGWLIAGLLGIAGISSFAMIKADLDGNLRNDRFLALKSRAQLYENWLNAALGDAQSLAARPELLMALQRALTVPGASADLPRLLEALRSSTVRAIVVVEHRGGNRRVVAQAGELELNPDLRLPLPRTAAELVWRHDALLESTWTLGVTEREAVTIVIQSELRRLTQALAESETPTGGVHRLCGHMHGQVRCLPDGNSLDAGPGLETVKRALESNAETPVFLTRAANGESLISAAAPVGKSRLVLVRDLPSREAYAPLRRYTLVAAPIMVLLVILAITILRYQVAPVATRLYRSERMATSANTALVSISEQLRASQERLSLITNNIPALISYLDAGLVYRFANAYYYEVLGRHPDEVVGHHARDVLGDAMFIEIEPWFRQVLSGLPAEYQVSRNVDGSARYFTVCYFPDYDADGKVQGFYSLSHDVTERKRTADALEESERRMRTITDNIPALISQFDTTERCRFANRRFLEYFDVSRQKALGASMRDLIGDDNYRIIKDELDTAMAGLPVTFERALRVRGETRFVSTSLMPQFDAAGKVSGCYGLTQDLTARKAAEMGRLRSEERLRTITDNMPALIAYLDVHGRFQFANRTWEDWLGQRTNHLIGYNAVTVLENGPAESLLPYVAQALKGERVEFETELTLPQATRHVRGTFLPHVDEDSQMLGVYGMLHDITALKLVEMKLSQLARFDSLTGMPNRNLLLERLGSAMGRARRRAVPGASAPQEPLLVAVLFLDLDRFKEINDTHGHAAGDAVLKQFAQRAAACVRETDTVGRLAGDEFVIVLEGLREEDEARLVADKILERLGEPCLIEGKVIPLSTSIGITIYRGEAATPEALLKRADSALYEAKHQGRNNYRMAA